MSRSTGPGSTTCTVSYWRALPLGPSTRICGERRRRAEVSSDPALLAVELQPRDPPTAQPQAVSSVSTVSSVSQRPGPKEQERHRSPRPHAGNGKKRERGDHTALHQEPEFFSLVPSVSGPFWRRGWCWQWGAGLGLGNSG